MKYCINILKAQFYNLLNSFDIKIFYILYNVKFTILCCFLQMFKNLKKLKKI